MSRRLVDSSPGGASIGHTVFCVDKQQNPKAFVDYGSFKAEAWDGFMAWLEANHGHELETVMWRNFELGPPDPWLTGDWRPEYSAESVALWGQYSQEYVAQLNG